MEKYSLLHIFSALCYFGSLSFFTSYHSVQDFHFPYISSQFSPISVRIAPMESGKKASSKITKKVLTHHGKTPWALNISGRYLCNKYIQSDFCSFNMMKYLEHPSRGFFAFFFFLTNSWYFLISNLISFQQFSLWVRQNGEHLTVSLVPNSVTQKCCYCTLLYIHLTKPSINGLKRKKKRMKVLLDLTLFFRKKSKMKASLDWPVY